MIGSVGVDTDTVYHRYTTCYLPYFKCVPTNPYWLGDYDAHTNIEDAPEGLIALYSDLRHSEGRLGGHFLRRMHRAKGGRFIDVELHPIVVGFCGAVYPIFAYWECPVYGPPGTQRWRYSPDPAVYRRIYDTYFRSKRFASRREKTGYEYLIDQVAGREYTDLFVDAGVPVWAMTDNAIMLNPCLRTLQFEKVKDPWTAFQEIMQFISGVLGQPARETVDITDRDMARQKGFDDWSFRRMPGDKKRRKKDRGKRDN